MTLTGCATATLGTAYVTGGVKFTAGSTGCNPVYEFWLQDTTGAWRRMTGFGGNTWTWTTAGWARGTYHVHVWANQQGSDYSAWQAWGGSTLILN